MSILETDLAQDYNVNESLDYSDSNMSLCMATIQPFSDSIVIRHRTKPMRALKTKSQMLDLQ
jgi:hypothetical protein